jgi:hypothetical protein
MSRRSISTCLSISTVLVPRPALREDPTANFAATVGVPYSRCALSICRSASAAAVVSQVGGFLGGSSVALRIASRGVVASDQSVLPVRRANPEQAPAA